MGRVEQSPVVVRVVTAIEPPHLAAAVAGGNKQIARTAWRKLQPPDAPSSLAFVQGLSEPVAQVPHANPFVVAVDKRSIGPQPHTVAGKNGQPETAPATSK
eukprot:GHVT01096662.1.p4 GENE.GHVT01096662.1~~GHVT01096662.1.p4  ORF type:complete len:101 (+),score=23.62 GHVT01096662.1:1194-1496(+)